MTVLDSILYPALRVAGVVTGAGRSASPEQLTDCLRTGNRMLDAWNVSRLFIYTIQPSIFDLSPPQGSYTVGPGGDFDMPTRPSKLERVNLILPGGVRTPLAVYNTAEWAALSVPNLQATVPTACYLDNDWPYANLHFYGAPMDGNQVELWTWELLEKFQDTGDIAADGAVEISFPPGYEDAIVQNLGVRMAQQYRIPMDPAIQLEAVMARANIKGANSAPPKISTSDVSGSGCTGGYFNYRTGQRFGV